MWTEAQIIELRDRVERYVRRRVRDHHLAEDLSQDVMVRLHAAADLPEEPRGRLAWALRVARNRVIDHYRARSNRGSVTLDTDHPADVQRVTPSTELAGCLTPMMRHLPDAYRDAVEMSELQGHSQQAVADRLGLSLSGAKSRVQRGRQRLREMLEQCCRIEKSPGGGVADFEPGPRARDFCGDSNSKNSCVHSGA